jgi:hypothetical protein
MKKLKSFSLSVVDVKNSPLLLLQASEPQRPIAMLGKA